METLTFLSKKKKMERALSTSVWRKSQIRGSLGHGDSHHHGPAQQRQVYVPTNHLLDEGEKKAHVHPQPQTLRSSHVWTAPRRTRAVRESLLLLYVINLGSKCQLAQWPQRGGRRGAWGKWGSGRADTWWGWTHEGTCTTESAHMFRKVVILCNFIIQW